jgi:hypothetical protein
MPINVNRDFQSFFLLIFHASISSRSRSRSRHGNKKPTECTNTTQ